MITSTAATVQQLICPPWCWGHLPGRRAGDEFDVLHVSRSVACDSITAANNFDPIFQWGLGAYSKEDGQPEAPFIMMGPDYEMVRDLDVIEEMVDTLEEALPKLRQWRDVIARSQGV